MPITDTHAHLYSPDESRYPMIPNPLRPPAGAGTIEHLRREMAAAGVQRVVAVQVSTAYRWENRLLADAVRENAAWMAGVCTLDPENPDSPNLLRGLIGTRGVRGMRSLPTSGPTPTLDHPGVHALWTTAAELGIPLIVNIGVDLADGLDQMLRHYPDLPVVLDHGMYPSGRDGLGGPVMPRLLRLADRPNLYVKLSWLVSGSDREYPFEDTHAQLRAAVAAFGPERCVWGSAFPCELWAPKATYAQHLALFREALGLTPAEQETILSTTPGRLWFAGR